MVVSCRDLICEALGVTLVPRRYRHTPKARHARRIALLVVSAWLKALEAKSSGASGIKPIKGLLQEIGAAAKQQKPEQVDNAMAQALLRRDAHEERSYSEQLLNDMGALGGIDFPTWCRLVVRLHELASGYQMM